MVLSWNEIKDRALKFSSEWKNTTREEADAKPFLDAFFNVFGITRRKIGTFEYKVKKISDTDGYIDLLWKGTILVEMKSRGKDLDKAFKQAIDYTYGLKQSELPKYVLVSDFYFFRLYDTEEQVTIEFTINELVDNVQHFGYLLGYQKKVYKEQDPVNIQAAELMGKLYDQLRDIGYDGHPLQVYLVRLLFCLFAEDSTIFEKQLFQDFIELRTSEDGSDLAARLQELFQVLNTPLNKRFKNIDESLNAFPYVNGKLFEEVLPTASFDTKMRQLLLSCCIIDWSKISPAIFGSMFQSVMNPKQRRNLGAHYTSESNIFKLIKPLFLDELWSEFESVKNNKGKLIDFHRKLSSLKFFDPACGCGNFLIITYRELRLLELEILRNLHKSGQGFLDVSSIMLLDVDMVYGIEYEEFPARIAEVAMWLMDHQMNMLVSHEFGQYYARLPLKKSANIVHADALEIEWETVIAKDILTYIIGNPPFYGSNVMSQYQRNQIIKIYGDKAGGGTLDYVTGWYLKSAKYIQNTKIKVAFVSTNSIVQGEQVGILWKEMMNRYGIIIHFAHRTFKWSNEAKSNAAVFCVIIGFANYDIDKKLIFEYEDIRGEPHEIRVRNINAYLIDAKNVFVNKRKKPLKNDTLNIIKGNYYAKSEGLIIEKEDYNNFILQEPKAVNYIKKIIGASEFINNKDRYCLWLVDCPPNELKNMPLVLERIERVRKDRLGSSDKGMRKLAETPTIFRETNNPETCIVIPVVSSEKRNYIPIGYIDASIISTNSNLIMPNGKLYDFGILTSKMHMSWVKNICGRLKSDYRYSKEIVYNNFPWPDKISVKSVARIEVAAQNILDIRIKYADSSLADLYDPLTMPADLVKAHNELDKAVDSAYSRQKFDTEAKRMEFLFNLYEKYIVSSQ